MLIVDYKSNDVIIKNSLNLRSQENGNIITTSILLYYRFSLFAKLTDFVTEVFLPNH